MGKTAFALSMLFNSELSQNGCYISLELSINQVVKRICVQTGIDKPELEYISNPPRYDSLSFNHQGTLQTIIEMRSPSMDELVERIITMTNTGPEIDYFAIDYVGLIKHNSKVPNFLFDPNDGSELYRPLRNLARAIKKPIIGLSQVSQEVEQNHPKGLPQYNDTLMDHKYIDTIMLLYRWDYYNLNYDELENRKVNEDDYKMAIIKSNQAVADWAPKFRYDTDRHRFKD